MNCTTVVYKLVSCAKHCVITDFVFSLFFANPKEKWLSVVSSVIYKVVLVPRIAETGFFNVFVLGAQGSPRGVANAQKNCPVIVVLRCLHGGEIQTTITLSGGFIRPLQFQSIKVRLRQ